MVFYNPHQLEVEHIRIDRPRQSKKLDTATNTREAAHAIESIGAGHHFMNGNGHAEMNGGTAHHPNGDENFHLPEAGLNLEGLEKSLLIQALDKARNNQTKAAALLGISRHTFRYRLEKYGILNH